MALKFHPKPGTILMCDFSAGFKEPEMTKKRPVVVISPKRKREGRLCTVLAISTVPPSPVEGWHFKIPSQLMPQTPHFQKKESWLKGDMIYRVSFDRLDLIKLAKDPVTGKRRYYDQQLAQAELEQVRNCAIKALGINPLTNQG